MLGGRYRVENELGRGGMAKVYRGEDTVLGRTVAVKVLAPQYADDPNFVERFRREAQAAARLSNPNVVSVFDTGSEEDVHFIVMEFVDGRTLGDYLTGGGRIMPDRALDIGIDVCRALEAAHAQGVVHRDIKPGNIMVTASGDVKVTDFGIARMATSADTLAQTAAILGTASYLSPEQAQGQPVDGRTDIYSLGCVLYEMVTGRPPFIGDSPVAVASKQVLEQPVPPSRLNRDVSPDLDAVILRALAKNADNRYQSAEELRSDLERVRGGLPVEATPLMPTAVAAAPAAGATRVMPHEAVPAGRTAVLEPEPYVEERSRWWIPVIVVLVILTILGIFLWVLAQNLLNDEPEPRNQGQLVAVPDVVGEQFFDARDILEDAGFTVGSPERVPPEDDTQEEGTVLEQDPAADEEVEEGSEVVLTVVGEAELVVVPDVAAGTTLEDAQSQLTDAGLAPGDEVEEASDVEIGLVIGFDPPSGEEVEPGSTVDIIVSSGPAEVSVPEVRCRSFASAQNQLERAGLVAVISDETVAINSACPLGNKVAAQDPGPGEVVEPGTTVTLFAAEEAVEPTGPTGATGDT
ncbi:MAG TPA: Stk1 family PASTA domain-containing Ser/Thr kinase [Actinomycetota bacterium]|nr:Stk1 family PASTA domain-containing Ser/Thr kinase [Actinomycetota bacterium]